MDASDLTQGRLAGILDESDFGTPCAELSAVALRVLESRYLLRNEAGAVTETPSRMFERVARAVAAVEARWDEASVERIAGEFFALMASLRFLPNSPTLMNAGKPKGQLSACFVLPLEDDLGAVFSTLRDSMLVHKTGGGTGFNFGGIRPLGDVIANSGGVSSGPMAFLRIFDVATQTVKQGGVRRGANMAILPVDHPDIEEFIRSKVRGGIENFNLSVGIPDAFMDAARRGSSWELKNPRTGAVVKQVSARKLWKEIGRAAWESGDPGVVFLDRIDSANPTPALGRLDCTNPCGEQPLLPYESCNLGSLNLSAYVDGTELLWPELERDVALAVRFLDNVIEANQYPVEAVRAATLSTRKIGVGVMGWADVLMEWGIPYDSDEAVRRGEAVMKRINAAAVRASEGLAEKRGAFPAFPSSAWAARGDKPRRNATVTTIAPTGTISIIAGVSSGIEPVFSLAFKRSTLEGQEAVFVHPVLKRVLREANIRSRKVLARILEKGSLAGISEISGRRARALRTALEIKPAWHLKMQAAFQRHTENGVSKTINLPRSSKDGDIRKIYEEAYALGCKGITVYRDLSKPAQVLRGGVGAQSAEKRKDLLEAVDWLLDDESDKRSTRKRVSVGLASLSRAEIKKARTEE